MKSPWLRLARPLYLLFSVLAYTLGAALAHYLGAPWQAARFVWGLSYVLAWQLGIVLLCEYFRHPAEPLIEGETPRQRLEWRARLLPVAAGTLAIAGLSTLSLLYAGLPPAAGLMLILSAALGLAWAMPPTRLVYSGYGEFILAILWANLIPALAFLLQNGEMHRLLAMVTFPLTFLALASLLMDNFASFATDQKYGRSTLLSRLTWQRGAAAHHLCLSFAFLLFLSAPAFGLPWGVLWPLFLVLPFAILQGWRLQQIVSGGRTLWKLSTALAAATFGLTLYFLTLTFWLR